MLFAGMYTTVPVQQHEHEGKFPSGLSTSIQLYGY